MLVVAFGVFVELLVIVMVHRCPLLQVNLTGRALAGFARRGLYSAGPGRWKSHGRMDALVTWRYPSRPFYTPVAQLGSIGDFIEMPVAFDPVEREAGMPSWERDRDVLDC